MFLIKLWCCVKRAWRSPWRRGYSWVSTACCLPVSSLRMSKCFVSWRAMRHAVTLLTSNQTSTETFSTYSAWATPMKSTMTILFLVHFPFILKIALLTLQIHIADDPARPKWEAFLSCVNLWHRGIHAYRLHSYCGPGLPTVWPCFQKTKVRYIHTPDLEQHV